MAYNTFNEVYFNNKSIEWYEKNTILLTKDTWRPLRRDDVVLCLYGARANIYGNDLKTYFKFMQMSPYMKKDMEIWSYFRDKDWLNRFNNNADEKKYTHKHYQFDMSEVAVNNNNELIIESPFAEEIENIYDTILEKRDSLYLIKPPVKNFLNYSELPNTK